MPLCRGLAVTWVGEMFVSIVDMQAARFQMRMLGDLALETRRVGEGHACPVQARVGINHHP